MKDMGRSTSFIYLVITAILWSLGGVLIKLVDWNPIAIAGSRSAIAAIVMLIYLRKPRLTWSIDQLLAAFFYAGVVILFVMANKFTTAANAILLQYSAPVYVALLGSWLLKEKANRYDWLTIGLVFSGMILFFLDELDFGNLLGNIFAILSGISFAFMIVFLRRQKKSSTTESVFLGNIFAALFSLPFMTEPLPSLSGFLGIILLGIVQLGISYILYSIAIKHVTALEAILVPVLEPILNPVWVFIATKETPGKWAILGGTVILCSVTCRYAFPVINKKLKLKT